MVIVGRARHKDRRRYMPDNGREPQAVPTYKRRWYVMRVYSDTYSSGVLMIKSKVLSN